MSNVEQLHELMESGQAGVAIKTFEPVLAEKDIIVASASLKNQNSPLVMRWSVLEGMQVWVQQTEDAESGYWTSDHPASQMGDPKMPFVKALQQLATRGASNVDDLMSDDPDRQTKAYGRMILILANPHLVFAAAGLPAIQAMADLLRVAGGCRITTFLIIPPQAKIPVEVEPGILPLTRDLPVAEDLKSVLQKMTTSTGKSVFDLAGPELSERLVRAGMSMTSEQFGSTIGRLLVRESKNGPGASSRLNPNDVWTEKARLAEETGMVKIHRETLGLDTMAGLSFVKNDVCDLIRRGRAVKMALVGPPGFGKTQIAKRLGKDVGLPVLIANLDAIGGKYVGDSEGNTRLLQRIIERNSPCVVVLDEMNRFISTDGGSSASGNNVDAKTGGMWLTWLSSPEAKDIIIIATANDVSGVSTMIRAGRFDLTTYSSVDRSDEQVNQVWDLYRKQYKIPESDVNPRIPRISPAEQELICRNASAEWFNEPLEKAAQRVVFIAQTSAQAVADLEAWGKQFCVDLETGRRFGETTEPRKSAKPSANARTRSVSAN